MRRISFQSMGIYCMLMSLQSSVYIGLSHTQEIICNNGRIFLFLMKLENLHHALISLLARVLHNLSISLLILRDAVVATKSFRNGYRI